MGIEQDPAKFTPSHTRFQRESSSIRRRFRTNEMATSTPPASGVSYVSSTPQLVPPPPPPPEEEGDHEGGAAADSDFYVMAKAYFDCREYRRAAHVLRDQTGRKAVFLRCYALYLVNFHNNVLFR